MTVRRMTPLLARSVIALGCLVAIAAPASASASCDNEAVRSQQGSTYLPECRGFEQSSPTLKNEQEIELQSVRGAQLPFQAAATEPSVAFLAAGGLPGSESAGLYTQYLAKAGLPGSPWQILSLNPESRFSEVYTGGGSTGEFQYYSRNHECGIEQTELPLALHAGEGSPQLPPGETAAEQIKNLYAWNQAAATYTLVTNVKPDPSSEVGNYAVVGASSDCKHVIFESSYQFGGAPERTLYEWSEGSPMRIASLVAGASGEEPAKEVILTKGGEERSSLNAISQSGSRVFFTAQAASGVDKGLQEVFLRENGTTTVEVSAPSSSATATQDTGARFIGASKDGTHVFFTANYGLTGDSSTGAATGCPQNQNGVSGVGCDLYDYNVQTGTLTDVSADANPADTNGAAVHSVLGISEDGSVIYFSASGQLVPGQGNDQVTNENEANKEANVYGYDAASPNAWRFIASIGKPETGTATAKQGEAMDTLGGQLGLHYLTARVSADGNYLLFATKLKVPETNGAEYNNIDSVTGQPDFESYEYSLASNSVTCVTCNPDRTKPPTEGNIGGPLGTYQANANGYLNRSLSSTGQAYFMTIDPIVAQATNANVNVYQWSPQGVAGCEAAVGCVALLDSGTDPNPTYFADASENGEHVYITAHASLVKQDGDELRDVYDVRVDGGALYSPPPAGCTGEACQGAFEPGDLGALHASESGAGGGNLPNGSVVTPPITGVAAYKTKSVVKGSSVVVTVTAPSGGRIAARGKGLKAVTMAVAKAGIYKIRVSLTKSEKKLLLRRRHSKRGVKLKVSLSFTPSIGKASSSKATVTFK